MPKYMLNIYGRAPACYVDYSILPLAFLARINNQHSLRINQVYVVEAENMPAADGDDRTDRDKRKIGVVKLGVSNGIINFVFGVRS